MQAPRLPILDTVAAALNLCAQHVATFLLIFWLPWFFGAVVAIGLDAFWHGQLRLGQAPTWLHELAWAPFSAMATASMVRFALEPRTPRSSPSLNWSRETRLTAMVLALWLVSWDALDRLFYASRTLVSAYIGEHGPPVRSVEWSQMFERIALAYQVATYGIWVLKCAIVFALYGLVAIIVAEDRIDWRRNWSLLRSSPAALFGIVIVTAITLKAVELGYSGALEFLSLAPGGWDTMLTWRENVMPAFLLRAAWFPIDFLYHALGASVLAEAYRRLTVSADA